LIAPIIGDINNLFNKLVITYNEYFKKSPSPIFFSTIFNQLTFHWFGGFDEPSSEALVQCLAEWGSTESMFETNLKRFLFEFRDREGDAMGSFPMLSKHYYLLTIIPI